MTFIFWTIVTAIIMVIALIYIVKLLMTRKNHLDFPNYLFIAISVFIIAGIFTGIHVFELCLKWTNKAPTVVGACTIEMANKYSSIYFEDENLNLSTSVWSNLEDGKYENCKATYYPISKEIIEFEYENKLKE